MRTFKLYLLLAAVLTALCFTLFIIVSAVSSIGQDYDLYKSLSPDNMSQFKKTNFITSYTYLTGDYSFAMSLGYEKSTIESLVNQQYGSQSNASSYGDARDIVIKFLNGLKEQSGAEKYYHPGRGNGYTPSFTLTAPIDLGNGKTIPVGTAVRSDCTFTCGVVRYGLGLNSTISNMGGSSSIYAIADSGSFTYGDLRVGSIYATNGHAEVIVAIDGDTVYYAGTGSDNEVKAEGRGEFDSAKKTDAIPSGYRVLY